MVGGASGSFQAFGSGRLVAGIAGSLAPTPPESAASISPVRCSGVVAGEEAPCPSASTSASGRGDAF